jgi:hypothetical protein
VGVGTTSGPGAWTAGAASTSSGATAASVVVASNAPGQATLNVTVTFLKGTPAEILEGAYATTVTGTVASN